MPDVSDEGVLLVGCSWGDGGVGAGFSGVVDPEHSQGFIGPVVEGEVHFGASEEAAFCWRDARGCRGCWSA